jgi:hypothetical protein
MAWILEHLNIVIVAIFIIGSILKSRFGPNPEETDTASDVPDFGDMGPPDASDRKMPPPMPSVPPPLVRTTIPESRNSQAPEVPTVSSQATAAVVAAAEESAKMLKHQQDLAAHLRRIHETKATTTGGAAATRVRIAASKSKSKAKPLATGPLSLRSRLQNPAAVRRAIVLKEILDRPVGLR